MDEIEKQLLNTTCKKDYKGNHYWQTIGCVGIKPTYEIFKCSQCKKIVHIKLETIMKAEPSELKQQSEKALVKKGQIYADITKPIPEEFQCKKGDLE